MIFSPGFPPWSIGGEEYYAYYQATELSKLGAEVHIIARNIGNTAKRAKRPSIFYSWIARFSAASPQILQYCLTTVTLFFSYLNLHMKPNLIHAHDPYGEGLAAILVKKIFRIPVIITWHAAELVDTAAQFSALGTICRCVVLGSANGVIVNSEFFRDAAIKTVNDKTLASKMYIVPPGVDVDKFKPGDACFSASLPSDYFVILSVCRLEKIKGLDILIKAVPIVSKIFPNVRFVIVGVGSEQTYLQVLSKKLNVSENVLFAGAVPTEFLPSYYSRCDVFTVPTQGEGFGMAFLEAMSSGKPIIVTKHAPEIAKLVRAYRCGLVIGDDPKELAEAIIKLFSDPHLKDVMGRTGRRIALNQYSWKQTALGVIAAYRTVICGTQ